MKLLLVHGRSQEDKHPAVLRQKWVSALQTGAESAGLELPITEDDIIFPYFGDALVDLTSLEHPLHHDHVGDIAPITRGSEHRNDHEFRCALLNECLDQLGVSHAKIAAEAAPAVRSAGPLSYEWVQVGLGLLDSFVPGISARSLNAAAEDVVMYLNNSAISEAINTGIAESINHLERDEPLVVVGHSLGSIIAYRLLSAGGQIDRPVRAFITLGSPLGIKAVRKALEPLAHPPQVESWFNAYDDRDAVALHPLDSRYFKVDPEITNYGDVQNDTPNNHGISGYLSDRVVAARLINTLADAEI